MNRDSLNRVLFPRPRKLPEPIQAGLYHTMREHGGQYTRFHLRVEPDGAGMLIANATAAAHLSPTGIVIVKELLDGDDENMILRDLRVRFRGASNSQLRAGIAHVQNLLDMLVEPGDIYPIMNLEDAAVSLHVARLMAPLEANIPLAEPEKLCPILSRLWEVGIPHVTILVPESPNPFNLVRAVEYAEELGLICGVSGRASDLEEGSLIYDLAMAGVDHVTLFCASADPTIHDALFGKGDHAAVLHIFERTQELEVADVGHIPLVQETVDILDETLEALLESNVPNAAFYAITSSEGDDGGAIPAEAMRQVAVQVEEFAGEAQVRYIWEPPVLRNPNKSLISQVRAGPRCSGDVAIRVETDGSVVPPRGPYQITGNILGDGWESIWQNDAFRVYRERVEAPTRCELCPGLAICAADCPSKPAGWSQDRDIS